MFEKKEPLFKKMDPEPQHQFSTPTPDQNLSKKSVFIGQSIHIKGELTGNEDLTIEGKVEGNIELKDHNLTIGSNGRIEAEVFAKNITIMGEVQGNVYAEDKVEITKTGSLRGNIIAPRVVIEDGARFNGEHRDGKRKKTHECRIQSEEREGKDEGGRGTRFNSGWKSGRPLITNSTIPDCDKRRGNPRCGSTEEWMRQTFA
jgi:cytoskeletal protein CcmA (bactofilin family)